MAEEAGRAELRELVLRSAKGNNQREFSFDHDGPRSWDPEKRTLDLEFSSEEPYERFWGGKIGYEILSHEPGACDLSRLNNKAALLFNHWMDNFLGSIRKGWIADTRRGWVTARFGKNALAENYLPDVISGDLCKVSVGYDIEDLEVREDGDGNTIFFVTKWTPYEVSIVTVPADDTVGTRGKEVSISPEPSTKETANHQNEKRRMEDMSEETRTVEAPEAPKVDVAAIEAEARQKARDAYRERAQEIRAVGKKAQMGEDEINSFIDGDGSVAEFKDLALDRMESRGAIKKAESAEIGMTEKETERFSLMRLVRTLADPNDRRARDDAAFELEACRAAEDRTKATPTGRLVPADVLTRDLSTLSDSAGGYTVFNQHGSFIEMLRNSARVMSLCTVMDGLNGDVTFLKQTGGGTAYWVGEGDDVTESTPSFGEVWLRPSTVGTYFDATRRFLKQTSLSAEQFLRSELASTLGLAIDYALLHGSGVNRPVGLASVSGIGSVAGGANGAAPDFADIVDLETQITQDNADIGSMAYLTNAKVAGKLKQTSEHSTAAPARWIWRTTGPREGEMNGYPAYVTNQVSSTLTKGDTSGTCSAIFFGVWSQLIAGLWGGLDINVDKASLSASGGVRIVGLQDVGSCVRQPAAFSAMLDATTA